MTESARSAVHVREKFAGWWDVTLEDTDARRDLAQYTSEFQAREAGRVNALRFEVDLVIHQLVGPTTYQRFDEQSGVLSDPTSDRAAPG